MFKCVRCSKLFSRQSSDIKRGRTKFCSKICWDKYQGEFARRILKIGKKQCKSCNKTQPLNKFARAGWSASGYHSYCILCKREHERDAEKKRRGTRYQSMRNLRLKRVYGITAQEYDDRLVIQGGGCGICGKNNDGKVKLSIDHDATTGKLRGILCGNCNRAIGQLAHNTLRLNSAIDYLTNSNW